MFLITLVFCTTAYASNDAKKNNEQQAKPLECSVTNTGSASYGQTCNGSTTMYTINASCTVVAASCSASDLADAAVVAGICATVNATNQARRAVAFLPPCTGPEGPPLP